jgi:hypothetical protein
MEASSSSAEYCKILIDAISFVEIFSPCCGLVPGTCSRYIMYTPTCLQPIQLFFQGDTACATVFLKPLPTSSVMHARSFWQINRQ